MAEKGEGTGGEQGCEPAAALGEWLGTHGVDGPMDLSQTPGSQPVTDGITSEAQGEKLIAADRALLSACQLGKTSFLLDPDFAAVKCVTWAVLDAPVALHPAHVAHRASLAWKNAPVAPLCA
jgi:hypothetical protein